ANLRNLPKLRPVRNIAVRIEELCVVEDVEYLSPEVNVHGFGYRDRLQDGKITLAKARPAADRAFCGSECPQQRWIIAAENCSCGAAGRGCISGIVGDTDGIE